MIYEDLPMGAFSGVTAQDLMNRYHIEESRELRQIIRDERLAGLPILNKGNKYFRSDDPSDFDAWIRTTMKKGAETLHVARAVLAKRPSNDGQMTLADYLTENIEVVS